MCSVTFSVLSRPNGEPITPGPQSPCGNSLGMLRARDLAFLLPGVVFQLVVVVQTIIAVVRSWPITANLTALRVAGTLPEEIRTFRKKKK